MASTRKRSTPIETDRDRLLRSPYPMTDLSILSSVEVYVGAGWRKGYVVVSCDSFCIVRLAVGGGSVCCYDARNIRRLHP